MKWFFFLLLTAPVNGKNRIFYRTAPISPSRTWLTGRIERKRNIINVHVRGQTSAAPRIPQRQTTWRLKRAAVSRASIVSHLPCDGVKVFSLNDNNDETIQFQLRRMVLMNVMSTAVNRECFQPAKISLTIVFWSKAPYRGSSLNVRKNMQCNVKYVSKLWSVVPRFMC